MKKKSLIVILITIGVLAFVYFGIKCFVLYAYNTSIIEDDSHLRVIEKSLDDNAAYNITHTYLEDGEDYYVYEDIKMKNKFKEYEELVVNNQSGYKTISFKDENGVKLTISKSNHNLVDKVRDESKDVGLHYDLTKDFEKENITSDIQLIRYMIDNYNKEMNLFSSIHDMKKSMAINMSTKISYTSYDDIATIVGDYNGYIATVGGFIKYVAINHKNENYYFTFYNCDDSFIYEVVSSLVIGNNTETPELISNDIINKLNSTKKVVIKNGDTNSVYPTIEDKKEIDEFINILSKARVVKGPVTSEGTNLHMIMYDDNNEIIYDFLVWQLTFGISGKEYKVVNADSEKFLSYFKS